MDEGFLRFLPVSVGRRIAAEIIETLTHPCKVTEFLGAQS